MNERTLSILQKLAAQRLEQERTALARAREHEARQLLRLESARSAWRRAASLRADDENPAGWRHQVTFLSESEAGLRSEELAVRVQSKAVAERTEHTLAAKQARDILERLAEARRAERFAEELAAERREQDELSLFRAATAGHTKAVHAKGRVSS